MLVLAVLPGVPALLSRQLDRVPTVHPEPLARVLRLHPGELARVPDLRPDVLCGVPGTTAAFCRRFDPSAFLCSATCRSALEQAWAAIRARHPDVPPVVVVLGAGSIGAPAGRLRLGHFAAMRWADGAAAGERLAEVFVGGEGLARAPVDVLGTLLHEAAHAVAHMRGIKDTSRQGRWHNTRFKALAEELGIEVTKDPAIGWSPTSIPEQTQQLYADTVGALGQALRLYRSPEIAGGETRKPGPPACVCSCGRRIRVALSVLDAGPITCGLCGSDFEAEQS